MSHFAPLRQLPEAKYLQGILSVSSFVLGVLGDADLGFVALSRREGDRVVPALALAAGRAMPGPCLNLHLSPNLKRHVFAKIMQSFVATAAAADLSGV